MQKPYYNPLSDMGGIKTDLMSLFCKVEDLVKLVTPTPDESALDEHFFDTPYIKGCMTASQCAIFIETSLAKVANQHLKEVQVDIWVVCHKDFIRLSAEERAYYDAKGIHGNRIDSAVQLIHSLLSSPDTTEHIKKEFSIGSMVLSQDPGPLKSYAPEDGFYGKCLTYTYSSYYQRKDKGRR